MTQFHCVQPGPCGYLTPFPVLNVSIQSAKCRFSNTIKDERKHATHQSVDEYLGTFIALLERVNIRQLLQQVHHCYGNMWFRLRTTKLCRKSNAPWTVKKTAQIPQNVIHQQRLRPSLTLSDWSAALSPLNPTAPTEDGTLGKEVTQCTCISFHSEVKGYQCSHD